MRPALACVVGGAVGDSEEPGYGGYIELWSRGRPRGRFCLSRGEQEWSNEVHSRTRGVVAGGGCFRRRDVLMRRC